jgi:predicted Rossmann fold nucleotide-binding protein DprA/Smf involved in DNA uptake
LRIAIVGSRRRNSVRDRYQVFDLVDKLNKMYEDLVLVSGGCRQGADAFAEEAGKAYDIPVAVHPVDKSEPIQSRKEFTQKAYARNRLIAEDAEAVFAWVAADRTGGTENTIKHAAELKRQIFLVYPDGNIYLSKDGLMPSCDPIAHLSG